MKLSIIASVLGAALMLHASSDRFTDNYPVVFAHRGCWLGDLQTQSKVTQYYVPENSLDGIRMAARMGYPTIELDVRLTLDSVLVCMHDGTVNRTMRNAADQSPIDSAVAVSRTSFEDLRTKYALASVDPGMRRQIPTLEEMLEECARCGIKPIMHCNIYEGYEAAVPILGGNFIAFSSDFDVCRRTRAITDNLILFDAGGELKARGLETTPANIIALLDEIGGWTGTSSMSYGITEPEMVKSLRAAGHPVQSSIFPTPHEAGAVRNGADILLSDFCWRPVKGMKPSGTVRLSTSGSSSEDEASFDRCGLGALTITIKGKGRCTVSVEQKAATGSVETRTYEFGGGSHEAADGNEKASKADVTERLSFRFWNSAHTISIKSSESSSFRVKAELYQL